MFYCKSALVRVLAKPVTKKGNVSFLFSLSMGLPVPSRKDAGPSLPSSPGAGVG